MAIRSLNADCNISDQSIRKGAFLSASTEFSVRTPGVPDTGGTITGARLQITFFDSSGAFMCAFEGKSVIVDGVETSPSYIDVSSTANDPDTYYITLERVPIPNTTLTKGDIQTLLDVYGFTNLKTQADVASSFTRADTGVVFTTNATGSATFSTSIASSLRVGEQIAISNTTSGTNDGTFTIASIDTTTGVVTFDEATTSQTTDLDIDLVSRYLTTFNGGASSTFTNIAHSIAVDLIWTSTVQGDIVETRNTMLNRGQRVAPYSVPPNTFGGSTRKEIVLSSSRPYFVKELDGTITPSSLTVYAQLIGLEGPISWTTTNNAGTISSDTLSITFNNTTDLSSLPADNTLSVQAQVGEITELYYVTLLEAAINEKFVTAYAKGTSAPARNASTGTYANPLSGQTADWSLTIPTLADGENLYTITRTFYSDNSASPDWSAATLFFQYVEGFAGKTVTATAPTQVFEYDGLGDIIGTPSTTVTANSFGFTTPEFRFAEGAAPTGAWGGATYSYDPANVYSNMPETIYVEAREVGGSAPEATDTITMSGLLPNQYTVILENEAHTVPANSAGTVSTFLGSGTVVRVYRGNDELTANDSLTNNDNQFRVLVTSSQLTFAATPVDYTGGVCTINDYTAMTAVDVGFVNIVVEVGTDGSEIFIANKVQTITKSKQGQTGNAVANVLVYRRSSSDISGSGNKPTAGNYDFDNATITGLTPTTWKVDPPADDGNPMYVSQGSAVSTTGSGSSALTWSDVTKYVESVSGVNGKTATAQASDYTVQYDQNGSNPIPNTTTDVTITGSSSGFAANEQYRFRQDGGSWTGWGGNSYTYQVQASKPAAPVLIEMQVSENGAATSEASDALTIAFTQDGADSNVAGPAGNDAYTVILTNEAHTFSADNAGTVTSYVGSGTDIQVYRGNTELTGVSGTPANNDQFTISITDAGNQITEGAPDYSIITGIRIDDHNNLLIDNHTLEYTITVGNPAVFTTDKIQTLSKSKEGADSTVPGPTGARGPGRFTTTIATANTDWETGINQLSDSDAYTAVNNATGGDAVADDIVTFQLTGNTDPYPPTVTVICDTGGNPGAWSEITEIIDGSLLVNGTVVSDALVAESLSALKGTIGTLETAPSGKRVVLSSETGINPFEIFDINDSPTLTVDNEGNIDLRGNLAPLSITMNMLSQSVQDSITAGVETAGTTSSGGNVSLADYLLPLTTQPALNQEYEYAALQMTGFTVNTLDSLDITYKLYDGYDDNSVLTAMTWEVRLEAKLSTNSWGGANDIVLYTSPNIVGSIGSAGPTYYGAVSYTENTSVSLGSLTNEAYDFRFVIRALSATGAISNVIAGVADKLEMQNMSVSSQLRGSATGPTTLAALTDTTISTLEAGDLLVYDGSDWKNLDIVEKNGNLEIRNTTNGGGAGFNFSDHSNSSYAQKGYFTYHHSDGASPNGTGQTFKFDGTEVSTAVQIVQTAGGSGFYVGTNEVFHQGNFVAGTEYQAPLTDVAFTNSNNDFSVQQRINAGIHVNTATNTNNLEISRSGASDNQVMTIGVDDRNAVFRYVEDTTSEGTGVFGDYRFILGGNNSETDQIVLQLSQETSIFSAGLRVDDTLQIGGSTNTSCPLTIRMDEVGGNAEGGISFERFDGTTQLWNIKTGVVSVSNNYFNIRNSVTDTDVIVIRDTDNVVEFNTNITAEADITHLGVYRNGIYDFLDLDDDDNGLTGNTNNTSLSSIASMQFVADANGNSTGGFFWGYGGIGGTNANEVMSLSQTGHLIVGADGTLDSYVRSYYTDGTYTQVRGYGIESNRGTVYIRPTTDNTQVLRIGYNEGTVDWNTVYIDTSSGFYVRGGFTEIDTPDADFVVKDSTDSPSNFIWRDHSASYLYLGTDTAVANFRSLIRPDGNNTRDIGTGSARWRDIYAYDANLAGDLTVSGTSSLGSTTFTNSSSRGMFRFYESAPLLQSLSDNYQYLDCVPYSPTNENRMQFYLPTTAEYSTDGGSNWLPTGWTDTQLKRLMMGRDDATSITILNADAWTHVRLVWDTSVSGNPNGYVFLKMLHLYMSNRDNTTTYRVERQWFDDNVWSDLEPTSSGQGGWPTHISIPHASTSFTNSSGRYKAVRITMGFTWGASNNISLHKINWYGTYPAARHDNVYYWDENGRWSPTNEALFQDGSSTTPSVSFASDTDTGWYWLSSGAMAFTSNGAQRANFNNTGLEISRSGNAATGLHLHDTGAGNPSPRLFFEDGNGDSNAIYASGGNVYITANTQGTAPSYGVSSGNVALTVNASTVTADGTFVVNNRNDAEACVINAPAGGTGLNLYSTASWTSGTLYAPGLRWREDDGTSIAGIRGAVDANGENFLALGVGWLTETIFIDADTIRPNTNKIYGHNSTQSRDKIRVWNDPAYSIGMKNNYTFGGLGDDFAMSFQFSNTSTRGFWWGDTAHSDAQGAMALTTDGELTVAKAARIGFGESDTTSPGSISGIDLQLAEGLMVDAVGPNTDPDTDNLYVGGYGLLGARTTAVYISNADGPVVLNHAGVHNVNTKLATTATGIDVTGNITLDGEVDGVDIAAMELRTITAGNGLTGGGTLEASRTLNVVGGGGITANADDIEIDLTDTTKFTSTNTASRAVVRDASGNFSAGTITSSGLTVTGDATVGGITLDGSEAIRFETDKHAISWNDGTGNFNIRVGNTDQSSVELCTEAGYAFQMEWAQSSGQHQFNVSSASLAVDDTISWRTQILYDSNEVSLRYTGSEKLATTASGVTVTGEGTATDWIGTSDARLKRNIQPLTNGLETVLNLEAVTHEWIDGKPGRYNGFIAQQVKEIDPSLVTENEEGVLGVNYMKAVPVLVNAIQQLNARDEARESKLKDLEDKLDRLFERLG